MKTRFHTMGYFRVTLTALLLHSLIVAAASLSPSSITAVSRAPAGSRTVDLPLGTVQGVECPLYPEITRYLGIPFSEPRLGPNRWTRPVAYNQPYPEPALQATTEPPPCGSTCYYNVEDSSTASEDCLFLNVWVPPEAVQYQGKPGGIAVLVYIHGGTINSCSASDPPTSGCAAAAKSGTIRVDIQFRRGPFGLLAHPATLEESGITGNWAMMDQQLALRWVQRHISAFGGDPNLVLVHGHSAGCVGVGDKQCRHHIGGGIDYYIRGVWRSAGAMAVEFHLAAPGSQGLFHGAISQSPPCVGLATLDQAYATTRNFLGLVNCSSPEDPHAEMACLRQLDWAAVMALSNELTYGRFLEYMSCSGPHWFTFFHYIMDGQTFPMQPRDAIASGKFIRVPYMVGFTKEEGRLLVNGLFGGPLLTWEVAKEGLAKVFKGADHDKMMAVIQDERILAAADPFETLSSFWTYFFFACPIIDRLKLRHLAETSAASSGNVQATSSALPLRIMMANAGATAVQTGSKEAPAFLYRWDNIPTCPAGEEHLAAAHGRELWDIFGLTENLPPNQSSSCNSTAAEVDLSDHVLRAWATMAWEGAPNMAMNGESSGKFPRWTPEKSIATIFDKTGIVTDAIEIDSLCAKLNDAAAPME